MEHLVANFIHIDPGTAFQVVLLGFIGSGGAFSMTPGMMNLGVNGVIAVASNITHKFGKAMVGSHKHGEAGNVDKKLAAFVLVTAVIGIQLAVFINSLLFKGGGDSHAPKGAGSNLYISLVFVCILFFVALSMLMDYFKNSGKGDGDSGPSRKIADSLARMNLPP